MPWSNSKDPEPPAATQKEATPEIKRSPESPASSQEKLLDRSTTPPPQERSPGTHLYKTGDTHSTVRDVQLATTRESPHTPSGEDPLPPAPAHPNYGGKPLTNATREETPTTTRELTHSATREEPS